MNRGWWLNNQNIDWSMTMSNKRIKNVYLVRKIFTMKDYMQYIEVNPEVMLGKPVVKGTRITVELILEELSAGKAIDELLAAHPRLIKDAILAAMAFAADAIKGERSYPIAI